MSKVQSESDLGNYFDYIFQIVGENLKPNPQKLFETPQVYLFIDKPLKIIWIWAGTKSRLFHRYIAANWAGKLKGRKEYQNFKYEVIKQGREPKSFTHIMNEINNGGNFNYPGESRSMEKVSAGLEPAPAPIIEAIPSLVRTIPSQYETKTAIPRSERDKLSALIIEIKEINSHVKYSIEHIENRLKQVEQIIKKYS